MAQETTVPTPTHQFMAALSAAEFVTAAAPVAPYRLCLEPHSDWGYIPGTLDWRIGVQLQFASITEVKQFADVVGLAVLERDYGGGQTYTFADGVLEGVPFRAWVLADAKAAQVAA